MTALQLTILAKSGGPLTKRISLTETGSLISDGSACVMSTGTARRFEFSGIEQFADLIGRLSAHQAIALGMLRPGLAEEVEITTRRKLNGGDHPNLIARTRDHLIYRTGEPAIALIDYDLKGMPPDVVERIEQHGGLWPSLVAVLPALANIARVVRRSTSAGLFRADTGEQFVGSGGEHVFVVVQDGSDIERFLTVLHARCWRAGFGWLMVGAGGQLLERSLVDRVVGSPERLCFEGPPVLDPPLAQDQAARRPIAIDGEALDTKAACPPLKILDLSILKEQRAKLAAQLEPVRVKAKKLYVATQVQRLIEGTPGMAQERARHVIERQLAGVLLPSVILPFDDDEFAGCTVADVLANPSRFEDATLADPIEGTAYGAGKAKIMRRSDGSCWINSFAHGGITYELKFDFMVAKAAIESASPDDAVGRFERFVLGGDLDLDQIEQLRNIVCKVAGISKRTLDARIKQRRQEQRAARIHEENQRRLAERVDPRPQIEAPDTDAPWLPQMELLNQVLGYDCQAAEPPMRDVEGHLVEVQSRRASGLHELTADGANHEETEQSRLPPPEQLLLTRLDKPAVAELIERYIEYLDHFNHPVHLGAAFVEHFQVRSDHVLPLVTAVGTMPIVLPDGNILARPGLDRRHAIVMRAAPELTARLPPASECTPLAVGRAMRFLVSSWLCDVAADYASRSVLLAIAMTIIERALLPERPAFFVTAGKRGGGKTTCLHMVSMAALGHRAPAAAWSPQDEERRKALFAYLSEGLPFILWDNLPRGGAISCPSIEKALTSPTYSDRVLQVSQTKTVPAYMVQSFTGNNITARGDMASRSLMCRLEVDRPDPENREFRHPDPIGWTEQHRGKILSALYTILRGNPRRTPGRHSPRPTRFKPWWDLVGSAIEFAADQHFLLHAREVEGLVADPEPLPPTRVDFARMFLAGEAEDEQQSSLATVLEVLYSKWPNGFRAANVAGYAARPEDATIAFRGALEHAGGGRELKIVTPTTVNWKLKAITDAPVDVGKQRLVLRYEPPGEGRHGGGLFRVKALDR